MHAIFFKKKENNLSTGRLATRQSQAPVAEATEAEPQIPASSHQPSKLHSMYEPAISKEHHSRTRTQVAKLAPFCTSLDGVQTQHDLSIHTTASEEVLEICFKQGKCNTQEQFYIKFYIKLQKNGYIQLPVRNLGVLLNRQEQLSGYFLS